jgi:RNA-directed DNA polymerase
MQALARANMVNGVETRQGQSRQCRGGWTGRLSRRRREPETHWPAIREQLLERHIPAHAGAAGADSETRTARMRELGIPTVTDRLIQQALLQVLQPLIDPTFSPHTATASGRDAARTMPCASAAHVQDWLTGRGRCRSGEILRPVNHDILMDRLSGNRIDKAVLIG